MPIENVGLLFSIAVLPILTSLGDIFSLSRANLSEYNSNFLLVQNTFNYANQHGYCGIKWDNWETFTVLFLSSV